MCLVQSRTNHPSSVCGGLVVTRRAHKKLSEWWIRRKVSYWDPRWPGYRFRAWKGFEPLGCNAANLTIATSCKRISGASRLPLLSDHLHYRSPFFNSDVRDGFLAIQQCRIFHLIFGIYSKRELRPMTPELVSTHENTAVSTMNTWPCHPSKKERFPTALSFSISCLRV